eukprot:227914-Chlamydomonas_euryale.AAC.2
MHTRLRAHLAHVCAGWETVVTKKGYAGLVRRAVEKEPSLARRSAVEAACSECRRAIELSSSFLARYLDCKEVRCIVNCGVNCGMGCVEGSWHCCKEGGFCGGVSVALCAGAAPDVWTESAPRKAYPTPYGNAFPVHLATHFPRHVATHPSRHEATHLPSVLLARPYGMATSSTRWRHCSERDRDMSVTRA